MLYSRLNVDEDEGEKRRFGETGWKPEWKLLIFWYHE
jgi:hypothetical protein